MLLFSSAVLVVVGWLIYRSIQLPKKIKKSLLEQGKTFDVEFEFGYSKILFDYSAKMIYFIRCEESIGFHRTHLPGVQSLSGTREHIDVPYQNVAKVDVGLVSTKEPAYVSLHFRIKTPAEILNDSSFTGYTHEVWTVSPSYDFEKRLRTKLNEVLSAELSLTLENRE
jgi:hypothetical protein